MLCGLEELGLAIECPRRQPDFCLQECGKVGRVLRVGLVGEMDVIRRQPVDVHRVVEHQNIGMGRGSGFDGRDQARLVCAVAGVADDRAAIDRGIAMVDVVGEDLGYARADFGRQSRDDKIRILAARHRKELVHCLADVVDDRRKARAEEAGFKFVEIIRARHEKYDIGRKSIKVIGQIDRACSAVVFHDVPERHAADSAVVPVHHVGRAALVEPHVIEPAAR